MKLEKIVVSPDKIREPLAESASSVSVIEQKDIEAKKSNFVKNIVTDYNSVSLSSTGAFGQAYVRIRGANPNHTLLLIDGIKVYDPASMDGAPDFANIPFDNVDRIEIVRGAQSSLYGSDAMGGIIAIESKKPDKAFFEAGMEAGSFGTVTEYVAIGDYQKGLHYSVGFSQFNTAGVSTADSVTIPNIQETDPYVRKSFAGRVDYELQTDLTIGATIRSISSRFEYDDSDMFAAGWPLRDNDELIGKNNLLIYSVYVEHQPLPLYDYAVTYSYLNNFRRDYDYNARISDWYEGTANRLDFQNNFHIHDFDIFSIGFDHVDEISDSYYDSGTTVSDEPKVFDSDSALYLQNKIHYNDLMGSTQNMRVDHHSMFGTHTTYKIDAFFLAPTKTRLRGAASTSFKAPTLYQLHAPANIAWAMLGGNPDLKPEKARSYEIGLDQYVFDERLRFSVTYFQIRFTDLIKYDQNLTTLFWGYENAAKAKSLGTEWEAEGELVKDILHITTGLTFTGTKDYSTDNELLRVPARQAHVIIDLTPVKKLAIHANINYTGISLSSGTDKLKPYTTVDASAEYEIIKHVSVYGKLNNAFNKHYQQVRGYGMPGIGAYGGVKVKY